MVAWPEDKAMLGSNLSAVPGTNTGLEGAGFVFSAFTVFIGFCFLSETLHRFTPESGLVLKR
jgi:hypothetical protein